MIKQKVLIYMVPAVTAIASVLVFDTGVMAKKVDDKCMLATAIFARGSGKSLMLKRLGLFVNNFKIGLVKIN